LSIYLRGVLNTADRGVINLSGPNKISEGTIGQLREVGSSMVIDTGRVYLTTPVPLDIKGQVFARSLVDIDASQINVLSNGFVRASKTDGLIDLHATENLLVATGGQVLSSGSIRLFGQNVRVEGFVDNADGTSAAGASWSTRSSRS
jgi:lipoprotein-anchoring transpeptidase ErfK/SrfK